MIALAKKKIKILKNKGKIKLSKYFHKTITAEKHSTQHHTKKKKKS